MFSNRQCLIYAAGIAFLLAPSCAKQTEADEGGTGNVGNAASIFAKGGDGNSAASNSGTGEDGNGTPGNNAVEDSNLVGAANQISDAQWQEIVDTGCNAWAIEPESSPAKLQLIVDVSSSMNEPAPGNDGLSKWEVTKAALLEAIPGVSGPGLANNTSVGLTFYPYKLNPTNTPTSPTTMDQCIDFAGTTPMAQLNSGDGSHREVLRAAFTDVVLGRGTPTADAYDLALNQIALSPEQQAIPGDTYLLLITDGRPTFLHGCYNPAGSLRDLPGDEVVTLVANAWTQNQVRTFIIGSPGSEGGRDWLSRAAYDGQTGAVGCNANSPNGPYCHMDMTTAPDFSEALRNGLNQVVAAVSGCKFDVPSQSVDGRHTVDTTKINPLIVFGDLSRELITRHNNQSVECAEGFRLLNNGSQVELCEGTCSRFMADPNAKMQLIFGCAPEVLDPIIL